MIPQQLQKEGLNFVLLKTKDKIPFQPGWQNKKISFNDKELIDHINDGGNYGVIGGGERNLVIIDFDDKDSQEKIVSELPQTFTVKTGSGLLHKYFFSNESKSFKVLKKNKDTIADIQGIGKQVVGPNSIHPNGNTYEIVDNTEIAYIDYKEIEALMKPLDQSKPISLGQTVLSPSINKNFNNDIIDEIKSVVSPDDVLRFYGVDTSKQMTSCPFHDSKGGKCLGRNEETIHCFHCDGAWNIFSFVMAMEKCDFKEALEKCADMGGISHKLEESRKKYIEESGFKFDAFGRETNFMDVVERFYKIQPFYYDRSRIWWLWNYKDFRWEMIDEVDLMNAIDHHTKYPNCSLDIKSKLLEAFKRIGRKLKPKEAKDTWIQFHKDVYDIETDERFEASPEYFITNPIPYQIGSSEETPNIDRLFEEWMIKAGIQDVSYVTTLQEIAAYCLLPSMPLHRIFCFIGEGLNGKGTYLRFIENLVGKDNKCATEIEILVANRFESSKLYKKLVCLAGEIDKGIFNKTKTLKSLSGDDLIRFEFKGKDGFDAHNYAKPLIATNHLPETSDKSKGFYRRWCIVDFPNTFTEAKNVLKNIPEEEYSNFCKKSLRILKELLKRGEFTNEGSIKQRENKYEQHAGKFKPFIKDYCVLDSESSIEFSDFYDKFLEFLIADGAKRKSKVEVGRILRANNYEIKQKKINTEYLGTTTKKHIFGLKWRDDVII